MDNPNHKPLLEYIKIKSLYGWDDIDCVLCWLKDNDMCLEMADLIVSLLKTEISKQQATLTQARVWLPTLFTAEKMNNRTVKQKSGIYPKTTPEEQALFNRLTAYHLLDMDIPEEDLKRAKEIIPNRTVPFMFYATTLEWLKKRYNLEFKNDQ